MLNLVQYPQATMSDTL